MTRPAVRHCIGVAAVRPRRAPDPLDFVPLAYQTSEGRYDDPDRTWRTLYLAHNAYGTWAEVLGRFRPHDDLLTALTQSSPEQDDPTPIPPGRVPLTWLAAWGVFRGPLEPHQPLKGCRMTFGPS